MVQKSMICVHGKQENKQKTSHCTKGYNEFDFFLENEEHRSSLGRYVFGSEISYNKAPPRLPGLGC